MGLRYLGEGFTGPNGGASSPAFSFDSDPDTGMYHTGSQLALSFGGVPRLAVDASNVQVVNAGLSVESLAVDGQVKLGDGNIAAPGLAFFLDSDTGLYREDTNKLGFAAGGFRYAYFGLEGSGILYKTFTFDVDFVEAGSAVVRSAGYQAGNGTAPFPAYSFKDDMNTGIFRSAEDIMTLVAGGTPVMSVGVGGIGVTGASFSELATFNGGIAAPGTAVGDINISTAYGYDFYAENSGVGSAGNRLWVAGPSGGEIVLGPRSGAQRLDSIRFRGTTYIDVAPYTGSFGYPVAYIREAAAWTPGLTGTTTAPTITYASRGGWYMRIGNLVWFTGRLQVSTISGGGGNLRITGLPFTVENNDQRRGVINITTGNLPYPTGAQEIGALAMHNEARIGIYGLGPTINHSSVLVTAVAAGTVIYVSGFYWTSDS